MSNLDEFRRKKKIQLWPISMLRVYTGVFFLYYGFGKVRNPDFADGLAGFVTSKLESSVGMIRPFLESVVLPNKGLFAFLVSWGELAIGIGLILGLATRWASIAGAIMVATFWATKGQGFLDAQNHDVIWFVIFVVLATIHAGRAHSVDERLADRFRFLA
ncbi:MAG: DoxX family protein [Gammaproteobacteria bacterium]|nr:DoxX family protein [Gammaproteobacteria bacterium]MBT8111484.1 DoxX family protein [Gammaproteobacteria bacterium]NND46871.1 DoxX family protein [Woeseiaceae bacterium]NNL46182.1 DoxX family protein [Woeseiaceae bacterium]